MNADQEVETSVVAASGAWLAYDYLLTLDWEINYVWSRPWSISSLIFFLNRYPPFIDTFLSLSLKVTNNSPEKCYSAFKVVSWFIVFGIILAEIILMLRTYAIWACRRSVMIGFIILGLLTFIPAIVLTQIELNSLIYLEVPYVGCYLGHASSVIIVAYILLVICETVIAVMMAIKAAQHLPLSRSDWVASLYRNGLLFYACLLGISLCNVFVPIINPHFANMLASPQRVMHSILCNRILFLIFKNRDTAPRSPSGMSSRWGWDDEVATSLVFSHGTRRYPPPRTLSSSEGTMFDELGDV